MIGRDIGAGQVTDRYCDPVTMDHIIDLRQRLDTTEKQLLNTMEKCVSLQDEVWQHRMKRLEKASDEYKRIDELEQALQQILWSTADHVAKEIAEEVLGGCSDGLPREG